MQPAGHTRFYTTLTDATQGARRAHAQPPQPLRNKGVWHRWHDPAGFCRGPWPQPCHCQSGRIVRQPERHPECFVRISYGAGPQDIVRGICSSRFTPRGRPKIEVCQDFAIWCAARFRSAIANTSARSRVRSKTKRFVICLAAPVGNSEPRSKMIADGHLVPKAEQVQNDCPEDLR